MNLVNLNIVGLGHKMENERQLHERLWSHHHEDNTPIEIKWWEHAIYHRDDDYMDRMGINNVPAPPDAD